MNDLRSGGTNPIPQTTPETRGNDWIRRIAAIEESEVKEIIRQRQRELAELKSLGLPPFPVKRTGRWSIFYWINDWLCRRELAERMRLNEKLRRAVAHGFADNRPPASDSGAWNEATWLIEVNEKFVYIKRLHEGKPVEVYRHMNHAEAAVHLAAISQGFQLPRILRPSDKPIG